MPFTLNIQKLANYKISHITISDFLTQKELQYMNDYSYIVISSAICKSIHIKNLFHSIAPTVFFTRYIVKLFFPLWYFEG